LQDEKLLDSRQKAKIWETIERKWTKAMFLHNKGRKREVNGRQEKILKNFITPTHIVGDDTRTKKKSGSS
jgi:hypothetical protein